MTPRVELPIWCLAIAFLTYGNAGLATGSRGAGYILLSIFCGMAMVRVFQMSRVITSSASRSWLKYLVFWGVLLRLALICVPPFTTHDLLRYLWDGHMLFSGFDPYSIRPDDAQLLPYLQRFDVAPEHRAYSTLYPPLALLLFGTASLFGPGLGLFVWKTLAAVASSLLLWLGFRLFNNLGLERNLALLVLNPLLLLEVGVGGHLDIFVALSVCAALLAFFQAQDFRFGILVGLGIGLKFVPGVLGLVVLGQILSGGLTLRRALRSLAGVLSSVALIYGMAMAWGLQPWGSLTEFFGNWTFLSPLGATRSALNYLGYTFFSSALLLCVGGVLIFMVLRLSTKRPFDASALALSLPLILGPVVFPWYLMPLAVLAALRPRAWLWAWLIAAPFSYQVIDLFDVSGIWTPAIWPIVLVATAWGLGLAYDLRSVYNTRHV